MQLKVPVTRKSKFEVTQMDCPSEENLIRIKLAGLSRVVHLEFDIPNRILYVYHRSGTQEIEEALKGLNLGSRLLETEEEVEVEYAESGNQSRLLWTVLLINFGFFLIEISAGIISRSMGLMADSLDMLADALVYGISLAAVGGTATRKKGIAKTAGYLQLILAVLGFVEVLRRFIGREGVPDYQTMIQISLLALIANGICLLLLQRSRSKEEAHMKASMIFTSNDIIINLGVIVAALLVNVLGSAIPDLVTGSIVFVLVLQGAFRILKLAD